MAASLGAIAKEGHWLQSRISGATAKASTLQTRFRARLIAAVAKGTIGAGLALGVVTGAVLLAFFGIYLALTKVLDPALAALIPAGTIFIALGAIAFAASRAAR